jgi:hypothetical protein
MQLGRCDTWSRAGGRGLPALPRDHPAAGCRVKWAEGKTSLSMQLPSRVAGCSFEQDWRAAPTSWSMKAVRNPLEPPHTDLH